MPVMTLISSGILIITLIPMLFIVTPNSALISIGGLVLIYAVIIKLTRQKLKTNKLVLKF